MTQTHTETAGRAAEPQEPPLEAPRWATHSVPEDGGVTHETSSRIRPLVRRWHGHGSYLYPTEVALSTTDLPTDGTWTRAVPSVQIEGGCYPLDGARQLRDALDELLRATDKDHGAA